MAFSNFDSEETLSLAKNYTNSEVNDLTSGVTEFSNIAYNTSYTITGSEPEGMCYWNSADETLDLVLQNGVILQIGQEMPVLCKNQTGSDITDGTPVMFAGSVGASGRIKIVPAIADGTYKPAYIVGMTTESIANGEDGFVTWFGKIRRIDTSGIPYGEVWNDGDLVYVSPTTAGHLTKVKPNAPNQIITVGSIIYADDNVGSIFVRPTWRQSFQDCSDVNGTALTTSGQFAVWDNANEYFDFTKNINDYIPYSGATTSVDLNSQTLTNTTSIRTPEIKTDATIPTDLTITTGAEKTLVLGTLVWDDIRVTPSGFDRAGIADPALVQYTPSGSGLTTYLYEFQKDDIAYFSVQIPHSYSVGQDITAHVHWTPGANGVSENGHTVGWKIDYTWASINGTFGAMATVDLSDACDGTNHKHQMTPDVSITGTDKGISSMLICNIKRTDTGTDDTWVGTANGSLPMILEIDFHFPIDTIGSRQRAVK